MSDQALIRLDWSAQQAAMTEAAAALKSEALDASALVGKVTDATTQETAVEAQKRLANIKALCEKARKAAKAPALDFGRRIDAAAEAFVRDIDDELARVSALIGSYQALELAKQRAAEAARQAEERRIQEERRQAELAALRAAESERQRIAAQEAEVARLAREAKSKAEQAALERQRIELERQKALAEAKSHDDLDRINAQASNAQAALAEQPKYEPVRAQGQRVKEEWSVEVTDIWMLARAHPACVKIEPRLTEIKSLLDAGVKVAGVRAEKVVKAGVMAGRQLAAIEV